MSWLTDPAQRILYGALDGLTRRQSAIASNLANIDTPGYRPTSVDFQTALREQLRGVPGAERLAGVPGGATAQGGGQAPSTDGPPDPLPPSQGPSAAVGLRTTDPRHFSGTGRPASPGPEDHIFDGSLRNDTNTVDLESEMTALAETQLQFGAVSRLVTSKLGMLRDVAGGR